MRRYTLYNQLMAVAAGLCLCWLCVACGEDRGGDLPDDDPNSCVVTITLRTSRSARPPQTKAGETITWEDDDEYERDITDWLVVAYDDENAELAGYTSREGTWTPDVNDPDDSHTEVEMRLPLGKYSFYAFANLQSLEDGTSLYQKITGAHSLAELSEVKILDSGTSIDTRNEEKKGKFGGEEASRKRIPMSSYATKAPVSENGENTADVTLFRMLGKVRIDLYNRMGTTENVTLEKLSMGQFRKGPIWLLPYGDGPELPEIGPNFPEYKEGVEFLTYTIVENGSIALPTSPDESRSYPFYQYETSYANTDDSDRDFTISVKAGKKELTDYKIDFNWMRRNDFLTIPIYISNIETTLSWSESRMPIGGLPEKKVYGPDNGIQVGTPFACTVNHAGDVTVEYELESIAGIGDDDLALKYNPSGEQVSGQKFCEATLVNNTATAGQTVGLLIDKNNVVLEDNAEITLTLDKTNPRKGSFTVRTQELGNASSAEIKLTLVATYGTETPKREIEIPYTIIITNEKKGGNS